MSQSERAQGKHPGNAERGEAMRRLDELRIQSGEEVSSFDALVSEFVDRFAAAGVKALRPHIRSLRGSVVNWLNEQLDASPDLTFAVGSVHEAALLSLTESAAWLLHAMPLTIRSLFSMSDRFNEAGWPESIENKLYSHASIKKFGAAVGRLNKQLEGRIEFHAPADSIYWKVPEANPKT